MEKGIRRHLSDFVLKVVGCSLPGNNVGKALSQKVSTVKILLLVMRRSARE